ncbi:hypothetical protein [Pseudomonas syringae]|uniref:hypothetical protein n=1 Tax=Pseudomonas syringae TaxID=317 RepID=UPI000A263216|nr:hypothetical protein [Pseudomonas syringae]OSR90098.1 hypothetical protein BV329_00243 [Pseudomonas syringae pv. actinidiae]
MEELIALMYDGMSETHDQVGGVFQSPEDEHQWYVPFLCQEHRFLVIFSLLSADPSAETFAKIIKTDSGHDLGPDAYSLKYAAADVYFSENRFLPLSLDLATRFRLVRKVPDQLVLATQTFIGYMPQAQEFLFFAGGESDRRIENLNAWYHRIGGMLAASVGFSPIHISEGEWHGYRKTQH